MQITSHRTMGFLCKQLFLTFSLSNEIKSDITMIYDYPLPILYSFTFSFHVAMINNLCKGYLMASIYFLFKTMLMSLSLKVINSTL